MDLLFGIRAVLGLASLIVLHELGHLLAARAVGISIEEFNVGFGPAVIGLYAMRRGTVLDGRALLVKVRKVNYGLHWRNGRWKPAFIAIQPKEESPEPAPADGATPPTEFPNAMSIILRPILLGGSVQANEASLNAVSPMRRLAFYAGGVAANGVGYAALLTACLCMASRMTVYPQFEYQGMRDPAFDAADRAVTVTAISANGPAYAAGLRPGDRVVTVNGDAVADATAANAALGYANDDLSVRLRVKNPSAEASDVAWTDEGTDADGLVLSDVADVSLKPRVIPYAFAILLAKTPMQIYEMDRDLVTTLFDKESDAELTGPVGIVRMMSATPALRDFAEMLAIISLSLAALNVLPLPMFDGGRIVYALCEIASRRRVPRLLQISLDLAFALFFMGSGLFITGRDILHWISGTSP